MDMLASPPTPLVTPTPQIERNPSSPTLQESVTLQMDTLHSGPTPQGLITSQTEHGLSTPIPQETITPQMDTLLSPSTPLVQGMSRWELKHSIVP